MAKKKPSAKSKAPQTPPVDLDALKRPPIIERYVDFQFKLNDSHFEKEIPEWLAAVSDEHDYPEQLVRKHWLFRIEGTGDNVRPIGSLYEIPRIQKMGANGKLIKAIEIVPSIEAAPPRLRFQQGRPTKKVCRFADLEKEVRDLLPDFAGKMGIKNVEGLWLSYRNELSKERFPEFNINNSFEFGRILSFFKINPIAKGSCIPPLRVEFSTEIAGMEGRLLKFRVEDTTTKNGGSLHLLLEYNGLKKNDPREIKDLLEELSTAHNIILDAFRGHFTREALEIFSK